MKRRQPGWLRRQASRASTSGLRQIRIALTVVVAILLPLALLASLLAAREVDDSVQQAFEQRLAELSLEAAQQIDTQLSVYRTAASVLATSDELLPDGIPGNLYRQAWQIGQQMSGWVVISSAGPGRPQLLNTLIGDPRPLFQFGADRPRNIDPAIRTLKPSVSDLVTGRISTEPHVIISTPVIENGMARYVVSVGIVPNEMSRLLSKLPLPPGGVAVVTDGTGHIVGRSGEDARRIGEPASAWSRDTGGATQWIAKQTSLRGVPTLFAVNAIASVPAWHVAVAVPVTAAGGLVAQPFHWVAATRLAIVCLALLGAVLIWLSWNESRAGYQELDRVLASVPAMILITRVWPNQRFEREFISRSSERVIGWPYEELVRMGSLTELMEPEMHPLLRAHLFKALTTGEESVFECQMRHADGASRRMRSSAKVVERHKDGSSSVVACVVDITDIHLAEQRLRLLEKLAVLGEVSSGIAHELNQPLAAIAMAAENGDRALLRDPPNLQTARDKFIRINEQAHRISAVIDHVRAFSRGDTKKAEPLDIGTVLHEALILLEARISANGIELDIDVPRDLPPVHAVSVLLEQAVMNVIGNACDAYRDNPLHTRRVVRIAARADRARLRLTIADQAGGIPEALLSRIFDPFFTTKPVGKGTGLGLSISLASIVEMGGRMTVRNQHGGACFEIVLPVEEAAQPALETVGSPA